MSKETGGPAFPRTGAKHDNPITGPSAQDGMTLRDYFAAKAMQAYITASLTAYQHEGQLVINIPDEASIAKYANRVADAMLEERK